MIYSGQKNYENLSKKNFYLVYRKQRRKDENERRRKKKEKKEKKEEDRKKTMTTRKKVVTFPVKYYKINTPSTDRVPICNMFRCNISQKPSFPTILSLILYTLSLSDKYCKK